MTSDDWEMVVAQVSDGRAIVLRRRGELCVSCGSRFAERHSLCQSCKESKPTYRNPFVAGA